MTVMTIAIWHSKSSCIFFRSSSFPIVYRLHLRVQSKRWIFIRPGHFGSGWSYISSGKLLGVFFYVTKLFPHRLVALCFFCCCSDNTVGWSQYTYCRPWRMRFCPENVTIHDIWINHGISSCFLETVTSSIVSLFILIFGIAQLIFYYRFATRIEHLPWNKLYSLQVFSHVILIVIACLDILLRHVLFQRPVLGFEVMFI